MARRRRRKKGSLDAFALTVLFAIIAGGAILNVAAEHMQLIVGAAGAVVLLGLAIKWARRPRAIVAPEAVAAAVPPPLPPKRDSGEQKPPKRPEPTVAANISMTGPGITIRTLVDPTPLNARARAATKAKARWIARGETVRIKDLTIAGGMFYLATRLGMAHEGERWIVDFAETVATTRSPKTDPPTYYPSYATITPTQRRGFLEWMAGGRSDPDENLSLVFLFVYGLEYRLLGEGVAADAAEIIAEAERLLKIYGRHGSFKGYVERMLEFARPYSPVTRPPVIDTGVVRWETPLPAMAYLGARLREGGTLSAGDAFIWATASPIAWRRRWPRSRIDVFERLWTLQFTERYPTGLRVNTPTIKIAASYRAMSAAFTVELSGKLTELPDISTDAKTALLLKQLVDECWTELSRYHSHCEHHPDAGDDLDSTILLPVELWMAQLDEAVAALGAYLGAAPTKITSVGEIMSVAELPAAGATVKAIGEALSRLAQRLRLTGIDLAPDGLHAASNLSLTSPACLVRLPPGDRGEALGEQARAVVDVAILYASQLAPASIDGRAKAAAAIVTSIHADDGQAARMRAYANIAQPDPRRRAAFLKVAAALPLEFKRAAALAAVAALAVSGHPPAQSVRQLEGLYKGLGLTADALYAALHRAPTGAEAHSEAEIGAVAIAAIESELNGEATHGGAFEVEIDPVRLERARQSTQAVAAVLSEVFVEEAETKPSAAAAAVAGPAGPFEGLDVAHGTLLSRILDAGAIPHREFERLARSMKLLAEGAVDNINEWAFDRFDEPVIEDAAGVSVAPHLSDRVRAMRKKV